MTYHLHYTSQDVDATTWSVYVEQYVNAEDAEPIDGSQRLVSTHANEAEADAQANLLQTLPNYKFLGQTEQETLLLIAHDKDEVLHPFVANVGDDTYSCQECGDTEAGLMHNNTWRNVEPLMDSEYDEDTPTEVKAEQALSVSPSPALAEDATYDEQQTFTVTISNTFEAFSPSEAVACMVAYLNDYAAQAGYRVSLGMVPLAEPSCFIDADDLDLDKIVDWG